MAEAVAGGAEARRHRPVLVVAGASLGTLFEWYDFFLYGSLAAYIARHFFTGVSDATAFIFALAAFAAGFIARPFGAVVFGRIGDVVGRKNTFLATMLIMGLSTFLVGLLPGRDAIGVAAPILLVFLRILQGLAVGGEYGGAAIYVAEHARPDRRGFETSWINMMATSGLILSLIVVATFRATLPEADFQAWGWRLPFLLSAVLLGISLWIRLKLGESPVYSKMKEEATLSSAPLSEAFGRWSNLKLILIALMGPVAGSTVIWYGSQFYAMFFLQRVLKVDDLTVSLIMAGALVVAASSYLFFGWLSDRIGRKPVMLAGLAFGALTIYPGFQLLTEAANPQLAAAQRTSPVVVHADPASCSVQFDPVGGRTYDTRGCDIAKSFLSREGVSYRSRDLPAGSPAEARVGGRVIVSPDPAAAPEARKAAVAAFKAEAGAALSAAGYPPKADPARVNHVLAGAIVAFLAMCAAATYAPIAAFLVELFPARIRYTSLSFPYHLGSGWIGGLLPATAFAIVATTGDIYSGLWYPIFFSGLGTLVCLFLIRETRGRPID